MKKINWRYAIGETIIVIIGISVAFSLNNWKESAANTKLKKQYLGNLVLDIKEEIQQLEENQTQCKTKVKLIRDLSPFLGKPDLQNIPDSIVQKLFQIANVVNFRPETTTYQSLIHSGDMKLIQNLELRRQLEKHYAGNQSILQTYKRIQLIQEKYLADFFVYEMDFDKLRKGDKSFMNKVLLKNIISSVNGAYLLVMQANKAHLESNQNLLYEIQKKRTN